MQYKTQIKRPEIEQRIQESLRNAPVTALLGPRQCGKTWLTRHLAAGPENYFDLHQMVDRIRLEDSNFRILDGLEGSVVIDEVQQMPELFPKLRLLADRPADIAQFLITGSTSPRIVSGITESLAGRVRQIELGGFTSTEVSVENWQKLWRRGGFPPAYLNNTEENSLQWRLDYISTFLRRDIPLLSDTRLREEQLRRLLLLIAHSHGQFWNHSEAGKIIGVSYKTVQRHMELFKGAFIIRELPPFFINIKKRLKKAQRIYLRDSGLLHALLMLREDHQIASHPSYGASWEGFAMEQIASTLNLREDECFYWSVQGGEEIDLVINKPAGRFGFEFKAGDAPGRTRSMATSIQSLDLKKLYVIYPGEKDYTLDDKIEVIAFKNISKRLFKVSERA